MDNLPRNCSRRKFNMSSSFARHRRKILVFAGGIFSTILVLYVISKEVVIVHENVCIVAKQGGKIIETEDGIFGNEKEIVVYNAKERKTALMKVSTSKSADVNNWPIRFETSAIPRNFSFQTHTAYFIIATHPGNLFHWWQDSVLGLYGVMKMTQRLNSTIANQVLHRNPITGSSAAKIRTRYADIVKAFSVRDDSNVYHAIPSGTCYPFGVFGYKEESQMEVANYVIEKLDKKYPVSCPPGITVTLIQRSLRKILNTEELANVLIQNSVSGFINISVVNLEIMTFKEQWQTIRCTHILVGVQGAGLQWAVFLRPKSAMLELAYDNWDFLFSNIYRNFNGLQTGQLSATETLPDWDYISNLYFGKKPMTEDEKTEVLSSRYDKKYKILWGKVGFKWADSKYDPFAFKKEILSLIKSINL